MAKNIRGNSDGENGENDSNTIQGRGVVNRDKLVNEVEQGRHPGHHTINVNGEDYVRSNPNRTESDNVNK